MKVAENQEYDPVKQCPGDCEDDCPECCSGEWGLMCDDCRFYAAQDGYPEVPDR